jgi:hypothetical protein
VGAAVDESSLKDYSLNNLTVIGPFVATIFALAYVVGYFYAFDIAWFAFFSIAEHLVFALRALPIAIGASALLIGVVNLPEPQREWFENEGRWLAVSSSALWIGLLFVTGLQVIVLGHLGAAIGFWVVGIGAVIRVSTPLRRDAVANTLYWGVTLTVGCLIVGYFSGLFMKHAKDLTFGPKQFQFKAMSIVTDKAKYCTTHVIFEGSDGVLFYDFDKPHAVRFVKLQNISEISESNELAETSCKSTGPHDADGPQG